MKLSELLATYGDDKVQFQNLDHCADKLNMNGTATNITFGTEQRLNLDGTEKLGLVVWLDRDRVAEIMKRPASAHQDGAWQPIETAPRDERRILATGGGLNETIEIVSYNERIGCWNAESCTLDDRDNEAEGYSRPTHWMPLPTPRVPSEDRG